MQPLSKSVSRLELYRPGIEARSFATGFFWRHNGSYFLVTNWHSVTGVNADTNKLMGDRGFHPTSMDYVVLHNGPRENSFRYELKTLDLYRDGAPIWLEHPSRRHVDCVAIPIEIDPSSLLSRPINELDFHRTLKPDAGMDCHIVGFPQGLHGPGRTPIWKRGAIASEPNLQGSGVPRFVFVDAATREGMSGSPVIVRNSGYYHSGDASDAVFGTIENLFGIYSGRLGDDTFGAQLGRVWKIDCVEEVFSGGVPGIDPNHAD